MLDKNLQNKIDNLSRLSEIDCALLIRNHLIEALESETYFELELVKKIIALSEYTRITFTEMLNGAIKKNQEKIGNMGLSEWLRIYLDKYAFVSRKPNTFIEFCSNDSRVRSLAPKDQVKLMRIYRIYDYFFVAPIVDLEYPIDNIFRFPMRLSQTPEEIRREMSSADLETTPSSGIASEKLAVKEALHKFPKLGEQSVTMSSIKLKQFGQPVRPSVRNWLYDYTMHLGQTGHSSMDRTNYLFRSDNAKNLSSPEREKLAILLKSFDENAPLPTDGKRQEIVFESFTKKEALPQRAFPAELKPSASINFIHHVERPSAPSAPVRRDIASVSKQQFPPEAFIKPYPKPEPEKDNRILSAPSKAQFSSPTSTKIDEDEITYTNPYPKPGTHETPFEKKDDNISNVRFSEGAPKDSFTPISQVSARIMPAAEPSSPPMIPARPLTPAQKPVAPQSYASQSAYKFTPPDRNIIRPHFGRMTGEENSEPRIQGNVVDLKGDK